jgi:hypothetical protein
VWQWLPARGRSGGMLCGIKKENFEVLSFESGEFFIMATVVDKQENKKFSLAVVYGPAQEDTKDQFLTELSQLCVSCKFPFLIEGDFNILRFSS